eukprot:481598-Pleurochrysis_carterae.AAC.1
MDTVAQTFEVEVLMHFTWKDPVFVASMADPMWRQAAEAIGEAEQLHKTSWRPCVALENCDKVVSADSWFRVKGNYVSYRCRVHGVFNEPQDLGAFPFDVQMLVVRVRALPRRVRFVEMNCKHHLAEWTNVHQLFDDGCCMLPEWTLLPHLSVQSNLTHAALSSKATQYNVLSFHVWVRRKWGFYVWNVVVYQCAIVIMTFCSALVEPSLFQPRLAISLTLMLTSVGVKYSVTNYLPKISYLTLLDRYMLMCFAMQALVIFENAVARIWQYPFVDEIGFGFLAVAFVLCNLGAVLHARFYMNMDCTQLARAYVEMQRAHGVECKWASIHRIHKPLDWYNVTKSRKAVERLWGKTMSNSSVLRKWGRYIIAQRRMATPAEEVNAEI